MVGVVWWASGWRVQARGIAGERRGIEGEGQAVVKGRGGGGTADSKSQRAVRLYVMSLLSVWPRSRAARYKKSRDLNWGDLGTWLQRICRRSQMLLHALRSEQFPGLVQDRRARAGPHHGRKTNCCLRL